MSESGPVRAVTRSDVAKRAGVSTALVSYVLTGARKVGPASEQRIRLAIEELGYRPNRTARALKTGQSEVIGVVLSDVSNPYFAELALEIEQTASEYGKAVMLMNSHGGTQDEARLIDDLIQRGVDGLIVGSAFHPGHGVSGRDIGTPVVWIDTVGDQSSRRTVGPAMAHGAEVAVRHLIEVHGSRRIALALGGGLRATTDQRQLGWERAITAAGLRFGRIVEDSWGREGGLACGRALFGSGELPDAVFAGSDLIAIGVLRAARDSGIAIPDQVALVSFDGTKESEFSTPRITTLRQPIPGMARAAVELLLDTGPLEPRHIELPGELIIRESCGCAAVSG